jgi:hypothetical protein
MTAPDTAPRVVELCASASAKGIVIAIPARAAKIQSDALSHSFNARLRMRVFLFRASHKLAETK